MPITSADLPKRPGEKVIFDLDDGQTIAVESRGATFYGAADNFDTEGTATEIVDKLNRWGARVAGWE